jgi:hypothetical protein
MKCFNISATESCRDSPSIGKVSYHQQTIIEGCEIEMGYVLDALGSIPGRGKIFLFSLTFRPALGPTQPPIQWVRELFPEGKTAGARS